MKECTHDLGKRATNPAWLGWTGKRFSCTVCNAVIMLVGNGVGKPFRQVIVG